MSAFEKWFQINFKESVNEGAGYLYHCVCQSKPGEDNLAWDWLKKTGDKAYTADTFIKAAKMILELSE